MAMTLDAPPTYQIEIHDVAYRRDGAKNLMATLYRPQGPGPFAAVVEVHGGAWTRNDRFSNATTAKSLAQSGVVVLSIEFRMPPEAAYPASLQDINYAIRWMKFHARDYHSTPDRVGIYGTSSGGHQVLLAALRPSDPRYSALPFADDPRIDATVAFVTAGWPVIDPLQRYHLAQRANDKDLIKAHHAFWGDEAMMSDGDPPLILERGETVDLPPAFLYLGTQDKWTPVETAERFVTLYRQRGGAIELQLFDGEPHAFVNNEPDSSNAAKAIAMLGQFIRKFGGAK